MSHVRSLVLVLGGSVLGVLAATFALPRVGAQESTAPEARAAALPADLTGEVSIFQGEARLVGKITGVLPLGQSTFVKLHPETGPDRYVNLLAVTAIVTK